MILTFLEQPENESNRTNEISSEALLSQFEAHIVESTKTVAEVEVRHCPDWFTMSKKILATNIQIRNATQKTYMNNPSELN